MRWDIEDYLWLAFILALIGLCFFIFVQSGDMKDCHKRGGTVVDTANGWVCAKLERI